MNEYLDLARELKRPWNMKVMVIPSSTDVLVTIPKGLEKRQGEFQIKGKIKTI